MQQKRNTCLAFPGRVSRAFFLLLLLLLLLCGTASAELVYSVASKDFSLENVTYDSAGAPQTGTLVEGIKASGVELTGTFSTAQGDWRVLTDIISRDITTTSDPSLAASAVSHTYSLYGLDKAQTAPLATSQKFTKPWWGGSESHLTSSALYVLSQDTSSSPYASSASREILKLSLDTLETSKKKSVKGYPQWDYLEDRGVIYYYDYSSPTPSLTLLDADLNTVAVALLEGYYPYNSFLTDLDDTSFALAFTSDDVQSVTDPESGYTYPTMVTKDLGILKISGSTQSVIVKAEDVGFKKDTGNWSIGNMVKDRKGGLYFLVHTGVGSNDVYHWDGSATTSIYEGELSESVSLLISDSAGNPYFSTSKYDDEEGKYKTKVYRGGSSVVLEVKSASSVSFSNMKKDNSGNVYFVSESYDSETSKSTCTLYRCGASDAKATELKSVNDGSSLSVPGRISDADFYFSAIKWNYENEQSIASYTYFHYNGTEVKEIHAFKDVAGAVSLPGDDMKHKTLYLYSTSQDVTAGTTTSTVLAFNNTDRHNPVKLKEFKVAGKISDVALYNYKVSPSSDPSSSKSDPSRPTPEDLANMTEEERKEAQNNAIDALKAGGNQEAAKAFEDTQLATKEETQNALTQATETEKQTLTNNAKSEMEAQGRTVRGDPVALGTVKFTETRLAPMPITLPDTMQTGDRLTFFKNEVTGSSVLLSDSGSDAVVFLDSTGKETKVVPEDHKVVVVTIYEAGKTYQPIVVASTADNSSPTSGKGSGGCDAGFGALALTLTAGVLLKKRSK